MTGLAALLALSGWLSGHDAPAAAALLLAAAMGAENTIFVEDGEVRVGLTYMTGTLVRLGKGVAAALFGEAPLRWAAPLLLSASLVAGAALGAAAYGRLGSPALWFAAVAVALLVPAAMSIFPLDD